MSNWESGKIKWYAYGKGYGFIKPDDGSADVMLTADVLRDSSLSLADVRRTAMPVHFQRAPARPSAAGSVRRACADGSLIAQLEERAAQLSTSRNRDDWLDGALMREAADQVRAAISQAAE